MERPQSHLVDTLGEAQMLGVFEPLGWVVNRIITDYGVDFDVQMFEGNIATGEWFKVQLKSSEGTDYSTQGDFISATLPTKHAAHYSTEMTDPIFLVHADVRSKRTFWFAPQLNAPIRPDDPRSSITVRIDTRNEYPKRCPKWSLLCDRFRLSSDQELWLRLTP